MAFMRKTKKNGVEQYNSFGRTVTRCKLSAVESALGLSVHVETDKRKKTRVRFTLRDGHTICLTGRQARLLHNVLSKHYG